MPLDAFSKGVTITPADGADLPAPCDAIIVGSSGNLSVVFVNDPTSTALTIALPAGMHRLQLKRVRSTGTTAANLTALYV